MTTRSEIQSMLDRAPEGARWVIIVVDGFDYLDYPVYVVDDPKTFWELYAQYDSKNMQRVMEVYDLQEDIEEQLSLYRCLNCPPRGE